MTTTVLEDRRPPAAPPANTPPGGPPSAPPGTDTPFSVAAIILPLLAIVMGVFMAILDNTVVNVALPTLGRVFNTDLRALQWVITGYMLAQASVIPLAGWFSDRFGAKRIYLTALMLFTIGSSLCALAPSVGMLIVFRVLQGLGGGMLMPIGMSFLYRLAPPDKRGAVMGGFGVPMLLAPALGPVISGWLLQYADWRLIFLINVPVGIIAVVVATRVLPRLPALRAAGALDGLGVVLGPLAFAALSYGIGESTGAGWTGATTLAGLSIGVVALVAFIVRELTFAHPLLELRVFRSRDFTVAILTQWLLFAGMFGTFFLIPVFLQQVRGMGAFETGLATLPQALVAAVFMPIGGRLFDRVGARPLAIPGLALASLSMWLMSQRLTPATTAADLRLPLALMGAAMGMTMMPLGTHVLNSVPRHLVSRVTSLSGALQNVVASLAIATNATYVQGRISQSLAALGAAGGRAAGAVPTEGALGSTAGGAMPPALAAIFAAAFDDTYRMVMYLPLIALLLAFTLRRPRASDSSSGAPHAEPVGMAAG